MRVRLWSFYVTGRPSDFWGRGDFEFEVEIPDDVKVVGCRPSSCGYELVFMQEIPNE